MLEPRATAVLLAALGVLLAVSALLSRAAGRVGVPVAILFVGVGMLAGSDGPVGLAFEDYALAFRLGTVALVLILFDGGLNTPLAAARSALKPALALATVGVVGVAAVVGLGARLLGLDWGQALLLGAIVSSTDAAATFAVLRGSGLALKRRVGITLELESGLNDPMAVILTVALTGVVVSGAPPHWTVALEVVAQLVVGALAGVGLGLGGRALMRRVRLPAAGLYSVLTVSLAFLAFGLPTLFHGSGFLSVYVAALLLGNETVRYRSGLLRVHDALAWLSQVSLFLMLGLLATPSRLVAVAGDGLFLGLFVAVVARPLAVLTSLVPFRLPLAERAYLAWVGLRGAVPIVLATFPVLAQAPGAQRLFDTVFFVVVVGAAVPGATVGWVTRRLGLLTGAPPPPPAVMEISSTQLLAGEVASFYVRPQAAVVGATLADLDLPPSSVVTLIIRDDQLLAPRGDTALQVGDYVSIFCKRDDLPTMALLFGQEHDE